MDILIYASGFLGFIGCWFIWPYLNIKSRGARQFIAYSNKRKPVAFLETDKAEYFKPIKHIFKNLAFTTDGDIIIAPDNSAKPCMDFGGTPIIHGDLYKSMASTRDLRMWIETMREKYDWTENDVALFLQEIEKRPVELDLKFLKDKIAGKVKQEVVGLDGEGKPIKMEFPVEATEDDKKKYDIYKALPSTVKNYIYTGINRISILSMLREFVYQSNLEKKSMNWIIIGIIVMIVVIVAVVLLPKLLPYFTAFLSQGGTSIPSPGPGPATIGG